MHVRERYPVVNFDEWERAYLSKVRGVSEADLRKAATGDLPTERLRVSADEWRAWLDSAEGKGFAAGFAAGLVHPKPEPVKG